MRPTEPSVIYRGMEYDIRRFKHGSRENNRKPWWHGMHRVQDPT